MNPLTRFARYVKADMWRPDEPRINVRKIRPGIGRTINLHAVRERLRGR
jgi:hypothetical protein